MSSIELPISDYVGDQTSVLDQAIRILQASIDVLTELGYLSSCLQMIKLLQCVKCARWPTDFPLSILPGVSIKAPDSKLIPAELQDLAAQSDYDYQRIVSDLHIPPAKLSRFQKAAAMIPNLKIAVQDITALSVTVTLTRLNSFTDREARIWAPKFPKSQSEGWFVILCDMAKDEIVAIKRVGWSGAKDRGRSRLGSVPTTSVVLQMPAQEGNASGSRTLDVLVVSDAYLGMMHKVEGVIIPDVPRVQDDEEGKTSENKRLS